MARRADKTEITAKKKASCASALNYLLASATDATGRKTAVMTMKPSPLSSLASSSASAAVLEAMSQKTLGLNGKL